ncbi:hypothetical protein EDB19DRAFT_1906471 [Suillus lakei]|nr:hypothetical protein EDB19DRAFT_1906471 [Suillus lakei]
MAPALPTAIEVTPFPQILQLSAPPATDQEFETAFLSSVPPSVDTNWPDLDYDYFRTVIGSESYHENSVASSFQENPIASGHYPMVTNALVGNTHLPPPMLVFHEHIVWKGDLDFCRFGHFDLNMTKPEDIIDGEPIDEDVFQFKFHVSLKCIGKYLQLTEVAPVPPLSAAPAINIQSANITWAHDHSVDSSAVSMPRHNFMLVDLALKFPEGQLSLVCGKLGSGKTLSLLALLDEADILTSQVIFLHLPPDALASFTNQKVTLEDWIVPGICAYVPQVNGSEICSLISNLKILEDGD